MIHFDLPTEKSSILKVIGVGGGGSNAVNYMFNQQIEGVNFVICNTDAQALAASGIPNRVQLGPHLTQGLGAGANPDIGRLATEESLEEIRKILEVNTKMAFITAGMGGGTGTGGAPIIAKICKDLGILTVGIVTTPFAYEGKKRLQQAEEGIRQLRQHVDTLLVISNDKLRHQFGNLKMREAFEKADNVLATAARCITDVINSTGQINVDFADVCTVMRNGGRAILGHAEVAGTHRAQLAIEEALNSPLLNDNEIKGAKWILININSARGESEFTMDEVEVIQDYLLTKAGENTDVILGMGYDDLLGDKLGITLIATGFEHKDTISTTPTKKGLPEEEKIVMVLGQQPDTPAATAIQPPVASSSAAPVSSSAPQIVSSSAPPVSTEVVSPASSSLPSTSELMPRLVELTEPDPTSAINLQPTEEPIIRLSLADPLSSPSPSSSSATQTSTASETSTASSSAAVILETDASYLAAAVPVSSPAAAGGYLTRPTNIYAEPPTPVPTTPASIVTTPVLVTTDPVMPSAEVISDPVDSVMPVVEVVPVAATVSTEPEEMQMQLVERDEPLTITTPLLYEIHSASSAIKEEDNMVEDIVEQQRRAAERLQKLRNLSYNVNTADPNNEFETIPAYVRRNMELYSSSSQIENFYSSFEVKEDPSKQGPISSLNTFLDGKKPD
ncbi:MAG: cell division protein FtsZ [Sphingomonadales bacterium]|nr:cell division protein FtsZ [Sphingomonadales bacterium]